MANPYQDVIDWLESPAGEQWSYEFHQDKIYSLILVKEPTPILGFNIVFPLWAA